MIPRITRFNYWNFVDINPIYRELIRQGKFDVFKFKYLFDKDLSKLFHDKYKSGDRDAIFEYAKLNPLFIRQEWIQEEIQQKIFRSNKDNQRWCIRLLFGIERGKREPVELTRMIERDKIIFAEILGLKRKGDKLTGTFTSKKSKDTKSKSISSQLAERFNISDQSIIEIYKNYKILYKQHQEEVKIEIDRAIHKTMNTFFNGYETNQSDSRQIKSAKTRLYNEVIELLKINRDNERIEDKKSTNAPVSSPLINNQPVKKKNHNTAFAQSFFTLSLGSYWLSPLGKYYPYGVTEDGFIQFIKDCKIRIENNRYFFPIHFILQSYIETIYNSCPNPTQEDFESYLDDLDTNDLLYILES